MKIKQDSRNGISVALVTEMVRTEVGHGQDEFTVQYIREKRNEIVLRTQ